MLTCGFLDAHKLRYHLAHSGFWKLDFAFFKIFRYITVGSFVRESAYCTCTEHVTLTEKLLCIFMYHALHVAGEVKVDIGRFLTIEAKEGFKGNVVAVLIHPLAADGTTLIVKVEARAYGAIGNELAMLTFGASVMGRQGVNLGDTREGCNKGRAYGATGADKVAEALGICNQLYGNHIKSCKAVFDNGA